MRSLTPDTTFNCAKHNVKDNYSSKKRAHVMGKSKFNKIDRKGHEENVQGF